jgi:putative endonuclease
VHWFSKLIVRTLRLSSRRSREPKHLLTGKRGEMEAYLHLSSLGYRIIASNVRFLLDRGEIDLIGWDGATLCFVEVKTRSKHDFSPPAAAVDRDKKRHIRSVAHRYLHRLNAEYRPHCRFDIVSIILPPGNGKPDITVKKGAFTWDADRSPIYPRRNFRR